MIHRNLQNVVYMKKKSVYKKKKKKRGGNIGSCPQVPVSNVRYLFLLFKSINFFKKAQVIKKVMSKNFIKIAHPVFLRPVLFLDQPQTYDNHRVTVGNISYNKAFTLKTSVKRTS